MTVIDTLSVNSVNLLLPPTIKPSSSSTAPPPVPHLTKTKFFGNRGVLRLPPLNCNIRRQQTQIIHCSKHSPYQDFQAFAEPARLLPVTDARFCEEKTLKKIISTPNLNASSVYILQLLTSTEFGSSLGEPNAAILVCLIDVDGNSILQRISLGLPGDDNELDKDFSNSERDHFQRGSLDTITLSGSNMGDLEALWIGLESGSWRLGGLRLTVIDNSQCRNLSKDAKDTSEIGLHYDFEVNDVFLGDGGSTNIVELRPRLCTEVSIDESMCLMNYNNSMVSPSSLSNQVISTTQGLKEYEDLKFSLLIYDLSLVSIGVVCLTFAASERASLVFLAGGMTGFLYLLSLQKSVDGLSSSKSPAKGGEFDNPMQIFGGINGPLSRLVLVVSSFAVVFKFGLGGSLMNITPQDLLFASLGFFTCKIAVVFAAFKPFIVNAKED